MTNQNAKIQRPGESGLAMTRWVTASVKNTGITKGPQTARANVELHSYQAFPLAR